MIIILQIHEKNGLLRQRQFLHKRVCLEAELHIWDTEKPPLYIQRFYKRLLWGLVLLKI